MTQAAPDFRLAAAAGREGCDGVGGSSAYFVALEV
jgi:hypothetical protein